MSTGLHRDHTEDLVSDPVARLIVQTRAAELLRHQGYGVIPALDFDLFRDVEIQRSAAVVEDHAQSTGHHLFKPDHEDAIRHAAFDCLATEEQRTRAGGAVVVHIEDRYSGAADPVEG